MVNFALSQFTLAAIACFLTACASIDVLTTPFVGAPHLAPVEPASVDILQSQPARPYERLGQIQIDASQRPAPPIAELEARLRKEAAKLGADAVIIVVDRIEPIGAYYAGGIQAEQLTTITGHRLIGVAIKYKPATTPAPRRAV